ncbi:MAG: LysM peptidoglycan-binding domain-containing protein [Succinivibrionaceae bacterium]
MIKQKITAFLAGILATSFAFADNLALREDHPDTYVVKKGDTLWDISGVFLQKPWLWPKIWQVNPQVKDPHWIYPGDVLNLVYIDGQPRLVTGVKKLSPNIRRTSNADAVKAINLDEIQPFLSADYIFPNGNSIDNLPYVMGDNRVEKKMADVSTIYIKGSLTPGEQYGLYSSPKKYKDPDTGDVLGYRASMTGVVVAGKDHGGITECTLIKSLKEVNQGDRVIPLLTVDGYDAFYYPKAAKKGLKGYILENVTDSLHVGRNQVVVLSLGASKGVSNGDVFTVFKEGVSVAGFSADNTEYTAYGTATDKLVAAVSDHGKLPDAEIGHAMVFKTYDNLSLALLIDANEFIANGLRIESPEN